MIFLTLSDFQAPYHTVQSDGWDLVSLLWVALPMTLSVAEVEWQEGKKGEKQ